MRITSLGLAPLLLSGSLLAAACSGSEASGAGDTAPMQDAATEHSSEASPDDGSLADGGGKDGEAERDGGDSEAADAGVTTLDEMLPAAADAICSALFRCCDATSVADYFERATSRPALQSYKSQVPPQVTLTETQCRDVVGQMLGVAPFGGWIENANAGRVTFWPGEVNGCYDELAAAACGAPVYAALHDPTCFGFDPPVESTEQRRMFRRNAGAGAACVPIFDDGYSAKFYGTCAPAEAFCCIVDDANPASGCALPSEGLSGTCQAAGGSDAPCSVEVPLDLCGAGLFCDTSVHACALESQDPLSAGAPCVDGNYNPLGVCQDSWCDVAGTRVCEMRKGDGADCYDAAECDSGYCENPGPAGQCAAWVLCVGP